MKGKKKLSKLKNCTDNREAGWTQNRKCTPKGGKKPGANSGISRAPKDTGTNRG